VPSFKSSADNLTEDISVSKNRITEVCLLRTLSCMNG
jgi:hypothetical protein